jgi:hypothetical protein
VGDFEQILSMENTTIAERHGTTFTVRIEDDLVDQVFNSSEKRLARGLDAGHFW